jgi:hypothetical protein
MKHEVKVTKWISGAVTWFATVFPGPWGALLTTVLGAGLAGLLIFEKWLQNPIVHTAVFFFVVWLWTIIGLVWLARQKPNDSKLLRYGLVFEGIIPFYDPNQNDDCLAFGLAFRNFSPSPIRYFLEEYDVRIETRTLPKKYSKNSITTFLARGAQRHSTAFSFKRDHIDEFIGKRVTGTLEFSIIYGDADREPVRRLRMSFTLILGLPSPNGGPDSPIVLGFAAPIESESDTPI